MGAEEVVAPDEPAPRTRASDAAAPGISAARPRPSARRLCGVIALRPPGAIARRRNSRGERQVALRAA